MIEYTYYFKFSAFSRNVGMAAKSMPALELFYCYAREDKPERDELDQHLAGLKRQYHITSWSDQEISPGTPWEKEIESHLNTAHIILLLVSARFMASDYCYSVEMQKALKRNEEGTACVIPILLRPVYLGDAPFVEKLQMLPTDAKPISKWADRDEALWDVTLGIANALLNLMKSWPSKEAWLDKGIALWDLNRYEEALATYEQALLLDLNYVYAWDGKGWALWKLKKYVQALAAYEQALRLDPNFANAWLGKGHTLDGLKRYEDALASYEQALRLDPNFVNAWDGKGNALHNLKRHEQALAAYEHALLLDPNNTYAQTGKSIALRNLNRS
jgi:tetratricopeptide (TPR) repeat protein